MQEIPTNPRSVLPHFSVASKLSRSGASAAQFSVNSPFLGLSEKFLLAAGWELPLNPTNSPVQKRLCQHLLQSGENASGIKLLTTTFFGAVFPIWRFLENNGNITIAGNENK